MNPALPAGSEMLRYKQEVELLRRAILKTLEDSLFVRESVFVIHDVLLTEKSIQGVTVQYFNMGTQKIVFLVSVKTSREEYKFLLNAVRPAKLRGSQDSADRAEADAEYEKFCLALLGKPYVEILGGEWETDKMILWTEELIHGDLMEDYIKKHEQAQLPYFIAFWKDLLRKHAELQCNLYAKSSGQFLNRDANAFNSIWNDKGEGRIIDIGTTMYTPDFNEFLLIFTRGTAEIEGGFPGLAGTAEIDDICDGVLDAFGEREGKRKLREFVLYSPAMVRLDEVTGLREFLRAQNTAAGYAKYDYDYISGMFTVKGVMTKEERDALAALYADKTYIHRKLQWLNEYFNLDFPPYKGMDLRVLVDTYLKERARSYVPRQVLEPVTAQEEMAAKKIAGKDYQAFLTMIVYNSRRFFALKDSPWIWLYLNARSCEQAAKDKPFTRAVYDLYTEVRADESLLEESGRDALRERIDAISARYGLPAPLKEYLRTMVSYSATMRAQTTRFFERCLANGAYDVAAYREEVERLSAVFSLTVTNPAEAAAQLRKIIVEPKMKDIFRSLPYMQDPAMYDGMLVAVQTVKIFQDLGFIAPEQALAFYKNIPIEELIKLIQFNNPSILKMLINADYKRFADAINKINTDEMTNEKHPSPLVPAFAIELFRPDNQVTPLESAYILNELEPAVIKEMLYAITVAKNSDWQKLEIWRLWCRVRKEAPGLFDVTVFGQTRPAVSYLGRINANKAIGIVADIICELQPGAVKGTSFIEGQNELIIGNKWRYNDLIRMLGMLPRNILLNAFRRLYRTDADKIEIFLDLLQRCGYTRLYGDVQRMIESDERLKEVFEERQRQRTLEQEMETMRRMRIAA